MIPNKAATDFSLTNTDQISFSMCSQPRLSIHILFGANSCPRYQAGCATTAAGQRCEGGLCQPRIFVKGVAAEPMAC